MNPLFLAIRAISSEFARRIYLPLVLVIGLTFVALLLFVGWLTSMSGWWWLLLVPIIVGTALYITATAFIGMLINFLRPAQTKTQKKDVSELVDKLQDVSDTLQMPRFLVVYHLVKDTIRPSDRGFISRVTNSAVSLKPDFQRIIASFK